MTNSKFFPAQSDCFAKVIDSFKGQKVAVLGHQRPDGDCTGSTVALVRMLRSLGIDSIGLNRGLALCYRCLDFLTSGPERRLNRCNLRQDAGGQALLLFGL